MPNTIWKKTLALADIQEIEFPHLSKILHVHEQRGDMCLWYECNPEAPLMKAKIAIVGTGHPMPEGNWIYLGTTHHAEGTLVFHIFIESAL